MMRRMLVPTDFSARSLAVLERALPYVHSTEGELLLLHVVEGAPLRWYAVDGQPGDRYPSRCLHLEAGVFFPQASQKVVHRDLCQEAAWKLATLLPPQPDRFHALVTVGKPADEIVRVARERDVDLIVMGTHGRRGLRRWFRGSVADRVRRKASVPVITFDGDQFCLRPAPGRLGDRAKDPAENTLAYPRAIVARGLDHAIQSMFPGEMTSMPHPAGRKRSATSTPPRHGGRGPRRASSRGSEAAEGARR